MVLDLCRTINESIKNKYLEIIPARGTQKDTRHNISENAWYIHEISQDDENEWNGGDKDDFLQQVVIDVCGCAIFWFWKNEMVGFGVDQHDNTFVISP